ncbi:MAG TPA: purine-nucleoside phosphorylase [Ktedonobacterales bacterium]|nr:purine-nucleoside phosphorylase [Ktedonobacterales bacterium]
MAQGNAYSAARAAAAALRPRLAESPRVAIVLGTGLGGLAEDIASARRIAYAEIPGFPQSTVQGHAGQLVLGRFAGVPVAALQGRFHLYEGYTPGQVVLPVRVLGLLGARILIVTNAAGGLRSSFQAGDLMLIRDHIGIPNLAGMNPLVGPNDEQMGTRFPAMTHAYDAQLREHAHVAAGEQRIVLHEGIYVMVSGPTFETPAELRYLRGMGGDAVGMSTVPEVVAAVHMGLRVLAISCITNVALPDAPHAPDEADVVPEPSHAEVIATAQSAGVRLATLIAAILARLARDVA